jgi:hypothetical protein
MKNTRKKTQPARTHRKQEHLIAKSEIHKWFEEQIKSRIPSKSFTKKLAETNDQSEVESLWALEIGRVMDEVTLELEVTDFEPLRKRQKPPE